MNPIKKIIILLCMISSCFADAGPLAFDSNDVSFLFPLTAHGQPHPSVHINEETAVLLGETLFRQILQFEHQMDDLNKLPYTNVRFLVDRSQWFVTSFRYEDCGHSFIAQDSVKDPLNQSEVLQLSQQAQCQSHLRLVIQPFNFSGQPLATAMHLVYNIELQEQDKILQELSNIKASLPASVNTTGLPLMIHPGLAAEVYRKETVLAEKIRQFLFSTLTASNKTPESRLKIITLTINSIVMGWKMVGGYVQDQKWTRFVTPFNQSLYDPTGAEKILLGVEQIQCNFYDYCYSLPNQVDSKGRGVLTSDFKRQADGSPPLPVRNQETEIMAENIDHASRTHFFNTNCLSCHESSNFRSRKNIFTDLGLPDGITPFTTKKLVNPNSSNIINFGYEGLAPRVSTRTASETVAVADRLNRLRGLQNPGKANLNVTSFWTCLMAEKDFSICLK